MASQESSNKPATKSKEPEKSSKEVGQTPEGQISTKKYTPREPKGIKKNQEIKKNKEKSETKENSDKSNETENDEKSRRKHDKLVKKAKRQINEQENFAAQGTNKKTAPWSTRNRDQKNLKDKENDKPKETDEDGEIKTGQHKQLVQQIPNFSIKTISAKNRQPSEENKLLREETKEEKGHNKHLLYTVYHKMELEVDNVDHNVKRETEPVKEIKYQQYDDVAAVVHDLVNTLMASFHEIFQIYKPNEILLSFNGGKDCTVVLHLLHKFYQMNACLKHIKISTLYITDPDAFEEVDEFVADCEKLFNIELIKKPGPIKKALEELCQERPHIKAVFMGCRRTDPYCQDLKIMQPTDAGWPALMRINPILDWKCRDIWQYMYMYNVPYCSLYQKGYTSIGNKKDTKPNPYLRVIDDETGGIVDYRPGHELIDNDDLERAGRVKIPKEIKSTNSIK